MLFVYFYKKGGVYMFWDNFYSLCKEKGTTPNAVAKALGYSPAICTHWKNGKKPSGQKLTELSTFFKVPIERLISDASDTLSEAEPLPTVNTYQIPVFESVSAGFGAYADDRICGYMPLFITSDAEARETICVRVRGSSMYPRIEDGALIQVHKQDYADNGQIVVMLVDGEEAVVKRYFCDTARAVVRLESYNPEYPPRVFRGAEIERLKILGVAKRVITDL